MRAAMARAVASLLRGWARVTDAFGGGKFGLISLSPFDGKRVENLCDDFWALWASLGTRWGRLN